MCVSMYVLTSLETPRFLPSPELPFILSPIRSAGLHIPALTQIRRRISRSLPPSFGTRTAITYGPIPKSLVRPETWRKVRDLRSPGTFRATKRENQLFPFREERMIDPILRVRFPVQCSRLDVNILIAGIKVHVSNCCRLSGKW